MDSCGWMRMGNEDSEGMADADATASWQQCYTWCTPYSHPHPHLHPPRQYQGNQYQQLPGNTSATPNASTHYPSSQQHHLQLQNTQPPPLDQQQHLYPIRGQSGLRRTVPYDGPGIKVTCSASILTILIHLNGLKKRDNFHTNCVKLNDLLLILKTNMSFLLNN